MSNLSQQIFATDDIATRTITVDAWGVEVLVKALTAKARSQMLADAIENDGKLNLSQALPDLVIQCTYDPETGERVFLESDREALMAKSAAPIEQIANVAMDLSGMSEGAVDAAGKDSSPTQTDDSSTN